MTASPGPTAPPGPLAPLEPATVPVPVPATLRRTVASGVALLCLAGVLLEAVADLLPDDPIVWPVTPVRLLLGAGLVAVLVAGIGWPRTPLDPAVALLLLAAAVATAVAGQEWAPWRGVLTGVATFYLVAGVRRILPDSGPALGLLALLAVAIAGSVAAGQAAGGVPTGFCRAALDASADVCGPDALIRAVGTFANPNLLAAFLVLVLPAAAVGAGALADRSSRLVGTAVVVVGYAAVLLSVSRGGMVAAVVGGAVFVALRTAAPRDPAAPPLPAPAGQRSRTVARAAALLAVLAVPAALLLGGGSAGVRGDVWVAAARLVAAHPLGVGPGRAGPLLDAAVPGDEPFQHAHDLWLNWAVETGVPGLVAVLAITAGAAAIAVRAARRGSIAAVAAGAGLAGFAAMSVADHPANAVRVSLALWAVLGLLAAEARPRPGRRGRRQRTAPYGADQS